VQFIFQSRPLRLGLRLLDLGTGAPSSCPRSPGAASLPGLPARGETPPASAKKRPASERYTCATLCGLVSLRSRGKCARLTATHSQQCHADKRQRVRTTSRHFAIVHCAAVGHARALVTQVAAQNRRPAMRPG
jgi:hypothetical protein